MPSDLVFDIIAKDQTRAGFEAANNNAKGLARGIGDAGKAAAKEMNALKANTANLAAQFQDITVQLQGGTSPFTVALQQGSQIGAVLGPMGAGGAVKALGAAFTSLVSPVNLITIGAIAAGGALYQMLANAQSEGIKAEDVLKNFDDLLKRIGETSKSSEDRIRAMIQAPASAAGLMADAASQMRQEQDLITQQVHEAERATVAFVTSFALANPYLVDMTNGLSEVNDQLQRGQISAAEALSQLEKMRTAETTPPSLYETIDQLRKILATAAAAEQRLNALSNSGVLKGSRVAGPAQATDRADVAQSTANMSARMGDWREKWIDDINKQTESLKPKEHAMSADERAALRQEKAYQKVTQSLEDELAMIGKSTIDQRVLEMQRRAGVDATSSQGQAIENLVRKVAEEKTAFEQAEKASKFFRSTFEQSMMQLVPTIETGNKALDTLINKLAEAALQAAFFGDGPLGGMLGKGLFSFFGFGGGRAVGGGVEPYTDYMVGENGPEIVRIGSRGGTVSQAGGVNGSAQSLAITITGELTEKDGRIVALIDNRAASISQAVSSSAISQYNRAVPGRVGQAQIRGTG